MKKSNDIFILSIFLWLSILVFSSSTQGQEKIKMKNINDMIPVNRALFGKSGPENVHWIEGGERYAFTMSLDTSGTEIRLMDPATGKDTLLFSTRGLFFPGTQNKFLFADFEWINDSKFLVLQSNLKRVYQHSATSDYYVYNFEDKSLKLITKNARAEVSPDGYTVGFEREGDLYLYNLKQNKTTKLTNDATPMEYNGHFDWVYEEEFAIHQGWKWSPDSRYIAFWHINESHEPAVQISNYEGTHPTWQKIRIAQPGDSITVVRIGVINLNTGQKIWLDTEEKGEFYIPRIYWTSDPDTLAVIILNRRQNVMKLFFFDVKTGARRLVFTENSDAWIDPFDVNDDQLGDYLRFPKGIREFFWISDRDGWQHIYRYDYSGRLINQVTEGNWRVFRIEGFDVKNQNVYYTSNEIEPIQDQLYAVSFEGKNKRRLTRTDGTHNINLSPDCHYYIDNWSAFKQPYQSELWTTLNGGHMLIKLENNSSVTQWLSTHSYSPMKPFSFTASDGQQLEGIITMPVDFDSTKRYPVIFYVYGGPPQLEIANYFFIDGPLQWYSQEGYIIVDAAPRGTLLYSSKLQKSVYRHLGYWESHDFAETAKYLSKQPWVDSKHIAIMGTSYGGYSALYTTAMYPGIFSVAIARSPVTSWKLYDAIYTERYMGLLEDNQSGYDSSSVMTFADSLRGHHILLFHGMIDPNVHPVNMMQLLTALTNAGADADLRIYPMGQHGAYYNMQSFMLTWRLIDEYLNRWMH
jgi:dipeptidyl-peptidase 4